ncbi:MAG: hypothetical protein ACK4K0_05945 [Flavobacteriales bacterium]
MLKHFLKKHFLITKVRNRFFPSVQIGQRQLFLQYQEQAGQKALPKITDVGFRVFSQYEEDGKILFIFSVLGMQHKTFVEIGSDDGINSNSANLYFNFGWHGLFIDGNAKSVNRGRHFFSKYPHPLFYPPVFVNEKVNRNNINSLIEKAGLKGEIGFLSIDVDGYDYWIWEALEIVSPQVVMIETNNVFGTKNIVVPYDPTYVFPGKHPNYHGASPTAMTKLANKKGYRLVGANDLGFNLIYVRNGLADILIPEVSVESVLHHPSNKHEQAKFKLVEGFDFVTPIE